MIGTGLQILAEALGDLFRRPVGDPDGVDELVASAFGPIMSRAWRRSPCTTWCCPPDAEEARAIARTALDHYVQPDQLRKQLKRLGFTDADVTRPGKSERVSV